MQKKFKITVEGRTYNVMVEDLTEYGGTLYPPPAAALAAAPTDATPAPAPAAAAAPAPSAAGPGDETSPLGGVVSSIDVAVGQAVKDGDKIAVIEAMKMKTSVYSSRAGTVKSIAVKPGDGVEAGQVLMTIA